MDHDLLRRLAFGAIVLVVLAVVAYVAIQFISVVVFAVFLYYAVRPIFKRLGRFGLPRRLRAMLALVLFGIPFVVLVLYTVAIVALEVQAALDGEIVEQVIGELDLLGIDPNEFDGLLDGVDENAIAEELLTVGLSVVNALSSLFVWILLVVISVYYMLVDGPRLVQWLLDRYDESGTARAYVSAVDPELSLTLFGNIVNVFVTAIIGIGVFYAYNLFAPAAVQIPFPALIGALAGIGSLIPVVGIKLVYVPVVLWLSSRAVVAGDVSLLVPVAVLLLLSAVLVDFIPDFFIRAHVSGDATHTGLLMLSYIAGPTLFGFYGLFLAPILLVLTINAITILVPYALTGNPPSMRQATLDEFGGGEPADRREPPEY